MSRRRGEFEHRTSIFEGAYRAWSHLGGLDLKDLETKPASELDPLVFSIANDPRLSSASKDNEGSDLGDQGEEGADGVAVAQPKREFPYEPLPRTGLAHPFVQAILSPWLGPDADQDAILLGLTSLRTWWQHRRKGESGSAIVALGTESMRGVVDGYTRHFFHLAHCLVVNEKEQPPRSLQSKMKDLEKSRSAKGKKRSREDGAKAADVMAFQSGFGFGSGLQQQKQQWDGMTHIGGGTGGVENNAPDGRSQMEQLLALQRRQIDQSVGDNSSFIGGEVVGSIPDLAMYNTPAELKSNFLGCFDLPILVQQVSTAATQLAHRGILSRNYGMLRASKINNDVDPLKYGDPRVTPVVIISSSQTPDTNDIQIFMTIEGITCTHCIKIIETVLKGLPGSRSPIDGILDAAADLELNAVLIKINNISDSRRIAHEAAQNLSLVGYIAKARCFTLPDDISLHSFYSVTERLHPSVAPIFRWNLDCECQGNNVMRKGCKR